MPGEVLPAGEVRGLMADKTTAPSSVREHLRGRLQSEEMMAQPARVINMDDHRTASPQLEDGFLRIANELFDAILRFRFTLKQQSVLLAIVRKTYGYGKKADDMSASQIGDLCGMPRNHVTETLNELQRMNVITKSAGSYGCVIGINKRHSEWVKEDRKKPATSPESGLVPNQDTSPESGLELVPNQDRSIVPNRDTQKTTFQKTTSKDKHTADGAEKPAPSVPAEFAEFWSAYPKREGSNSKADALKAWNARIRAGVKAEDMLAGVKRYAAFCAVKGMAGTQYVKQAASFLGTGAHWAEAWAVQEQKAQPTRIAGLPVGNML